MRGILAHAAYVPYRRLDRTAIAAVAGGGGGIGTRAVASYDEDTTTMGVEAGRRALRRAPGVEPAAVYFATTAPAYLDKTNATAIHAALRLPARVLAADTGGAVRSAVATLRLALGGPDVALVVAADTRTGLPGSGDEAAGGDGASAVLVGGDSDGPLVAEFLGSASVSEEFLDRWRVPGEPRSKQWEERFGEGRYLALGEQAWDAVAKQVETPVTDLVVTGVQARAAAQLAKRLGGSAAADLAATIGFTGAAHPGLVLSETLAAAGADRVVCLLSLADGADALVFRTTGQTFATSIGPGAPVSYGTFLAWRGMLPVEPPRRPEPARVSAPAAARRGEWKFGFAGSRDDEGEIRLPPAVGAAATVPMADARGTVVTFTVDRLAYSPSPPVVFAVVDFDGGGRLPVELTDVDADRVAIGDRVEMTFRRLSTADGIANYFWKARPVPESQAVGEEVR